MVAGRGWGVEGWGGGGMGDTLALACTHPPLHSQTLIKHNKNAF